MAAPGQRQYRPQDSADESGYDTETSSEDSWFSSGADQKGPPMNSNADGVPNFRAFATQIQLRDAAGRQFSTVTEQLAYGIDKIGKNTGQSEQEGERPEEEDTYDKVPYEIGADGNNTSLVLIDSRFRDRTAYPQPTFFTLRVPRVQKNVTGISLSDIKLLTSFYFFRPSKGNTDITVQENGRTTQTQEGTTQSTIVKRQITTGSQDINALQAEVQLQLNQVPLFFDQVNGFSDFIGPFRASGDQALNFNQPGEFFFNNTTNLWIPNPTMDTIVTHFWKSRYAGLSSYTIDQVLLAQYYPVLNEYLQDEAQNNRTLNLEAGIGIDPTITTVDDVIARILQQFQGISPQPDPVVLAVIKANVPALDKYRLEHTFRQQLINRQIVGRDTRSQNVQITSPSLNTSLVNLLNKQRDIQFNRQLILNNLTLAQQNALALNVSKALAVLQDMYTQEQTQFLDWFAVPWSQQTLGQQANLNNSILIRNGVGAVGIPSNDSEAVLAGIVPLSNDILTTLQSNPPYQWPNLTSTPVSTISYLNLSSPTSSFQYVYRMTTGQFDSNHTIIEAPNDYFYTDLLSQSANAVCPIQSGKQTVFKFRSPVRQTMQVETLPRPTEQRIPAQNLANFNSSINYNFDLSQNYFFTPTQPQAPTLPLKYQIAFDNLPTSNLIQIPGWSSVEADSNDPNQSQARNFTSSVGQQTSSLVLDVVTPQRALQFTFTTPEYSNSSPNSSFTYSLNLGVQFQPSPLSTNTLVSPVDTFQMFLYHDRGGFQGDVLQARNENPRFWKVSTTITTTDVSQNIVFTAQPNQQQQVSLRANTSNFGTVQPRVFPWFSSSFTLTQQTLSIAGINPATDVCGNNFNAQIASNFNQAQVQDSNFIRLPISSNLWPPDPSLDPTNQFIAISNVPMGQDTNNVSTDYTDYVPYGFQSATESFTPFSNLGIDPITQYLFQSNAPQNTSTMTFLQTDSPNAVFNPGLTNVQMPSTVLTRQEKIIHQYSPNQIPQSDCNIPFPSNFIGNQNTAQQPQTISTTLGTPLSGQTQGTNSNLQLNRGVLGFNFIPQQGVWDVKRVSFRSAIEDQDNDPNQNIKYMGVQIMGDILSTHTVNLSLSSALVVLSNSARVTYTSTFTLSNNGFDIKGGSQYEFQKDNSFPTRSNVPVLGQAQFQATMSDQPESMQTLIGFDKQGQATTIKALSGSAVPQPFQNNPIVSTAYLDGTPSQNSNQSVIFPSTIGPTNWPFIGSQSTLQAPPTGNDGTQSQQVLSQPIGTSVLNQKVGIPLASDSNFLQPWTTTLTPTKVIGNVADQVMLQDTNFNIQKYESIQNNRTFDTPTWTLTADEIYPSQDITSLVGIAANSSSFYFLGLSNDNNINFYLRMKRQNPITGVLSDQNLDSSFVVPVGGTVRGFTMNDLEQMVVAQQDTTNTTKLQQNLLASTSMTSKTILAPSTATISMDPTTSTLQWMPLNGTTQQGTSVQQWSINNGGAFPGTQQTPTGVGLPSTWTQIAANSKELVPSQYDRVFLISQTTGYDSNLQYTSNWNTGLGQWNVEPVSTTVTTLAGAGQPIANLTNGFNAGVWLTANSAPKVWGNRNSEPDTDGQIQSAWQIFQPFQKIVLEKLANSQNPITDLTYLDYPEQPHTAMFYYRDETKFNNDTKHKWGLESSNNFLVGDPNLSGQQFNSQIFNVPLIKSASPSDYQQLTVRGYSPTETSETLIRFQLPNVYNFGQVTQLDLIGEISTFSNSSQLFNSNQGVVLSNFNLSFQQSNSLFGQGLIPNFDGSNFDTSNFQGFASNVSTIYQNYQSNANLLSNINFNVNSNLQQQISTTLKQIIPASASTRANFTDPLTFSLLWKSGLLPQYRDLLENWGLGQNLGYAKIDTPLSTQARATSFQKILEDYIQLRINPQQQSNKIDSTSQENFNKTRDPTGSVQSFQGKLILNNFGSFSSTFISNPLSPFNPPIGKLETMQFEWVDVGGTQIDNTDCDWTASLAITEATTQRQKVSLAGAPISIPGNPANLFSKK